MADLTDYIVPVAIGSRVTSLTGKSADGFTAGSYAAFIQSVTGEPPTVVPMTNKRASIMLNEKQKIKMSQWLDKQLTMALAKPKDESLVIEMNPVLVPWALKYAIPMALFFVLAGWVGHWYLSR